MLPHAQFPQFIPACNESAFLCGIGICSLPSNERGIIKDLHAALQRYKLEAIFTHAVALPQWPGDFFTVLGEAIQ